MTLISVTVTILKPISPDVGRHIRFGQNSHTFPATPGVPLPMLVASADMPARQGGGVPEAGTRPKSSAGFQLALKVPPASVPFLSRGQPAMRRRLRWTKVDEQEHSAGPETPESGETAPATELMAVAAPEAVTESAAGPGRERRGDGVRDVITSR